MSTYLPGVTDTGFNPINYTPNFPYLVDALERMQAKYDANYNDIVDSYQKVNKDLLSPDNIAFRDQLLDKTKKELKQLSSTDLSIAANANKAEQIFAPYWDDKELLQDYAVTSQYKNSVAEYNRLKNSDKKEDRDRAWDMGKSYVDLTAQEMQFTKRGIPEGQEGSIFNVKARSYIPYINVASEINKELEARGYKKGIVRVETGNGYFRIVKNGNGTSPIYEKVVNEILAERPDLNQQFQVQGAVEFQNSVYNQMAKAKETGVEITRNQAILKVKDEYATKKIKYYNERINENDNILKGTEKNKGLIAQYEEKKAQVKADLENNIIGPDSPEIADLKAMKDKIKGLQSVNDYYTSNVNDLNSPDFRKDANFHNSELYFTGIWRDNFVKGYALTRELAYQQEIKTDANFAAARTLDMKLSELEQKMLGTTSVTTDFGNTKVTTKQPGVSGGITAGGSSGAVTLNADGTVGADLGAETKPNVITTDVPTVGGVYAQNTQLKTSYYDNLMSNMARDAQIMKSSGVSLIQSGITPDDVPGITTYIDYLMYYDTRSEEPSSFKDVEMKKTFEVLKQKNILPEDIKTYNTNVHTQINALANYALNKIKEDNVVPTDDAIENYKQYSDASKRFLETSEILDNFEKQIGKEGIFNKYGVLVKKTKDNTFKLITANDILTDKSSATYVTMYDSRVDAMSSSSWLSSTPGTKVSLDDVVKGKENSLIKYQGIVPRQIAEKYIAGRLPIAEVTRTEWYTAADGSVDKMKVKRYEYDDGNGNLYDLTSLVNKYGTTDKIMNTKEALTSEKSNRLLSYVKNTLKKDVDEFVMNKSLIYRNDFQGNDDKAHEIAYEAIKNADVIKGGFKVPLNFETIYKNYTGSLSKEQLGKVIQDLSIPSSLRYYLEQSKLSYSGRDNKTSSVMLEINAKKASDQLQSIYPGEISKSDLPNVLNAIQSSGGLEYGLDRNMFLQYAKDNYISSIVTDNMLKNGYSSTDWEYNNLHYKMKVYKGANNTIQVSLQTRKYDNVRKVFIDNPPVKRTFSSEYGLDAIIKTAREAAMPNARAINEYLRQQALSEKNQVSLPNGRRNNETTEQYLDRILEN